MPGHVFFVLPEVEKPTGGVNVCFQFAEILRANGQSASCHFQTPGYRYKFVAESGLTTYSPPDTSLKSVLGGVSSRLGGIFTGHEGGNCLLRPSSGDLVLVPEYWYAHQVDRVRDIPHAILAQDPTGVILGVFQPIAEGRLVLPETCRGFVTTSRVSSDAVSAFSGLPHFHVPLFIDSQRYGFQRDKKNKLIYFPRKRRAEADMLRGLLDGAPELAGVEICAVEDVSDAELLRIMGESLFFLSLSWREGFGLLTAEAMATGSIAIGYPGVGGTEYFSPDIGFPVAEDETVELYSRVVEVVQSYSSDPAPLDAMRERASKRILGSYKKEKTEQSLLNAVREVAR